MTRFYHSLTAEEAEHQRALEMVEAATKARQLDKQKLILMFAGNKVLSDMFVDPIYREVRRLQTLVLEHHETMDPQTLKAHAIAYKIMKGIAAELMPVVKKEERKDV